MKDMYNRMSATKSSGIRYYGWHKERSQVRHPSIRFFTKMTIYPAHLEILTEYRRICVVRKHYLLRAGGGPYI